MNKIELQNGILIKGFYTSDELDAFIENQKTKPLHVSAVYNSSQTQVNESYRKSEQVKINQDNPFINKLRNLVPSINEESFRVGITKYCEENDFVQYDVGGKFEQHKDVLWPIDVFAEEKLIRKLTTVVLLNDDFTGGKLALWKEGTRYSFDLEKGDVVTFPSYVEHKVDPVLTGTRYTVVSWSYGEF